MQNRVIEQDRKGAEATLVLHPAQRLDGFPPYVFASLGRRIAEMRGAGIDVIRLDIGSPDLPPASFILDELNEAARQPDKHGYGGYFGQPSLRQAMAVYYQRRFGVSLDPDTQVLPLIGSKEGIVNLALAFVNPGDLVLVPDPGYPAYSGGIRLAGGKVVTMPLLAENGFLPDLDRIPADVAAGAKLLWLNYPNNPTSAVATLEFFEKAVAFARAHGILVCHDAPYVDVTFDGYRPPSLLQVPDAHEVSIEFNSLSKTYNMAGWRVGMAVGNQDALAALGRLKSNVDSGLFLAIQSAAEVALTGDQSWLVERNAVYQHRRDIILEGITAAGLKAQTPQASLYVWARIPRGLSSFEFTDELLNQQAVSVAPGSAFGLQGEGFVRISLGQGTERIREAMERLQQWRHNRNHL
jgi:LL-diaminopimelate aminotransferase